jgi:hypothetical protein
METENATIHRKMPTPARQLPITGFAHKAGVVPDHRMAAGLILAASDMPAERSRAATLDCAHHLQLVEAHMAAVGLTPSGAVIAEDVRDLQSRSSHGRRRYGAGGSSVSRLARLRRGALRPSSGLSILAMIPVATRV